MLIESLKNVPETCRQNAAEPEREGRLMEYYLQHLWGRPEKDVSEV